MKKIFTTAMLLSGMIAFAQTGKIGINEQKPSATLDIKPASVNLTGNSNEGLLIPKMTKQRVSTIANTNLVEGTLVYVDSITGYSGTNSKVSKIISEGFYYYDGTNWRHIGEEVLPRWTFVNQDNIFNDIAINNYNNAERDTASLVFQSFDGTPSNEKALPLSPSKEIVVGNVSYKGKLGAPYDDTFDGGELNTTHMGGVYVQYKGVDTVNKLPKSRMHISTPRGGAILIDGIDDKIYIGTKTGQEKIEIWGKVTLTNLPVYASDAAADADANLPSGALYRLSSGRAVYQKP